MGSIEITRHLIKRIQCTIQSFQPHTVQKDNDKCWIYGAWLLSNWINYAAYYGIKYRYVLAVAKLSNLLRLCNIYVALLLLLQFEYLCSDPRQLRAYPHLYISCKQTARLQLANQSDKQTKAVRTTLPACQLQTVAHTHATYIHMNTRSYIAHTPIYTHTRIHTIIWHMPLQNIDSSANRKREREERELQGRETVGWTYFMFQVTGHIFASSFTHTWHLSDSICTSAFTSVSAGI